MRPKKKTRFRKALDDFFEVFVWCVCIALACLIANSLLGCSSVPTSSPTATPKYELTLSGQLDGSSFAGIDMGSAARSHTITISSKNDVNYFIAQTCHRFDKKEDVISQGWFPDTKSWSYQFSESPTLEDTGDCPLRLCSYSKTVGAPPVQCAVIDFMNEKYTLPAENICNGADALNHGKSMCHTKVGLVERVRFKEEVIVADPLPVPQGGDPNQVYLIPNQCAGSFVDPQNTLWQYVVPASECYVIFAQKAKPHARAKLTVIPYDLPLYSGGN